MHSKLDPPIPPQALDFVSHSIQQTQRVGARLGELLTAGDIVLLEGPLGSGKTVLAQGIAQGLGATDYITSPSFTLINEYRPRDAGVRLPLYHIDFYRLGEGAKEAAALGLDDYLYGDGVCVIEWPERAMEILPPEHLLVRLSIVAEYKRGVLMIPRSSHYAEVVREFKKRAFGV